MIIKEEAQRKVTELSQGLEELTHKEQSLEQNITKEIQKEWNKKKKRKKEVNESLLVLAKEVELIIKKESERFHKLNKGSDSGIDEDNASGDIKVKDQVYITNKYT